MKHGLPFLAATVLAVALLDGCGLTGSDHEWQLMPATVLVDPDGAEIQAPETVRAGVPFNVQITTTGNGCKRKGTTEAATNQQTRRARVTALDYTDVAADVCTEQLKLFEHSVALTFDTPGTAVIEVPSHTDNPTFAPVVHTRTVQVVP